MGDIIGQLSGASGANQGFDWQTNSPFLKQLLGSGQSALTGQGGVQANIAALLGMGGDSAASDAAYQRYLGSTGYQSQLQSGQQAINSNSASKGLLNSGATAKALTTFGNNLGAQSFNNYLGQLTGLNNDYQGTINGATGAFNSVGDNGTAAGAGQYGSGQDTSNFLGGLAGKLFGFI